MRRFVISIVCALVLTSSVAAQSPRADSAAAVAVVTSFNAALAAGDSARAVAHLADDVVILESGGIETHADYLAHHLGADIKASQGAQGERSLVKVTVVGDLAYVVSRTVKPPTGAAGNTGSESTELMVVGKSNGVWKIRAVSWASRRRRA